MTEVYGTAFIETARDYLVALLEALKTSMAAYSPTFSYVYEKHNQADLRLNAVSVGLAQADSSPFGAGGGGVANEYAMVFAVRVHTAYSDGFSDNQAVERLLNSLVNKFQANYRLGDNYRISAIGDLTTGDSFEESATKGGKMLVTVTTAAATTQE